MVVCLERGADLHMAQLMPLSLASAKSRLVLPFWYRPTRVVPEKGLLNGSVLCHGHSSSEIEVEVKRSMCALHEFCSLLSWRVMERVRLVFQRGSGEEEESGIAGELK